MPPMRYVTERRLAAVHAHLGRFAIDYRKVFGESPSQTLRRGREVRWASQIAQP
jgi:hypothetical protein